MQELTESTVSPSDSLKKFIENWADEEPSSEMNPMEANMNLRDKLRDDVPAGTVYMINATDVQYFENNGIPIVSSDTGGFQLVSFFYSSTEFSNTFFISRPRKITNICSKTVW